MKKPLLKIEKLHFTYDNTPTLTDVNLEVFPSEFIGIFGPNGGGKTTLLKLILGLLTPSSGSVRFAEKGFHMGYVPQIARFDRAFPISALEVVMMGCLKRLSPWGAYPKETKAKALSALERVGLAHKAHLSFGKLSGGEAQRVLIARAIVDDPQILLLDEPTASVDAHAERNIYQLLMHLNQNMTILMVTHDLQTIIDKAGRLFCVQRKVTSMHAKEVCEHFALGLYHSPLTTDHFKL